MNSQRSILAFIPLVCLLLAFNFAAGQTSESKTSKSVFSTFTYDLGSVKSEYDFTFSTLEDNSFNVNIDYGSESLYGFTYLVRGRKKYLKTGLLGISIKNTERSTLESNPQNGSALISEGHESKYFRITGVYEIGKYVYESSGGKVRINTGIAFYPNYQRHSVQALIPDQFSYQHRVLSVNVGINAGLEYALGDKVALHCSVPVNFIDTYYSRFNHDNPLVVEQDRISSEFGSDFKFGEVGLSFGLLFSL